MKDLPASHPLYGSEQSKSGFGICYQFAIKCPVSVSKTQYFQGFAGFVSYSHSTQTKQICLINIASPIWIPLDSSMYLQYSACKQWFDPFVIIADNTFHISEKESSFS